MKELRQDYHPAEMEVVVVDTNDIICTSSVEKTITTPASSGFSQGLEDGGELN